MIITKQWLQKEDACLSGVKWFLSQKESDGLKVVKKLIVENKLDWANWLIVRMMTYKQHVSYAVFAAEQCIDIYEKKYPDDNRPRLAIEAAKQCIKNPSPENKSAARSAMSAAMSAWRAEPAAWSAWSAESAARSAMSAARLAWSAESAAWSSWSAESAAWSVWSAESAESAAWSSWSEMKIKILKYGIKLLEARHD